MTAGETRTFPGRGHRYDLAIVGAGISGSEATVAAARAGLDVLLVTTSLDTVYMLAHSRYRLEPPAGSLMSRLLREDQAASGTGSGGAAEEPGSGGRGAPVAGAGRTIERWSLHRRAKYALEGQGGVHLLQSNVTGLIVEEGRVLGVRTWEGVERLARATALCVGSFLQARLVQGQLREAAGRLGEMAYDELYEDLKGHGVDLEPVELELGEHGEGLPYRVSCRRIAAREQDGYRVKALDGLYSAGVCAAGSETYEESARRGMELAEVLVRNLSG